MKKTYIILLLIITTDFFATGLIIPTEKSYPKDLLRYKNIELTVNINGSTAETVVYEEFINESLFTTDGVYSFPLPIDARALGIYYWRNDTLYQAQLRVEPQETNPGTGEGGIAAQVNTYIGSNGLRIKLLKIKPNNVQKVEIHYLTELNYHNGAYKYSFPLNTSPFVDYQIEHLDINVNVNSDLQISSFYSESHPDFTQLVNESNNLRLHYNKSKAYLAADFYFEYAVLNDELGLEFISTNLKETGGHFAIFYNAQNLNPELKTLKNRILFLLENSSNMVGAKLTQSINAIKEALGFLGENDKFNIILFNSNSSSWRNEPQDANLLNINSALEFLDNVSSGWGNNIQIGLQEALNQITDTTMNNAIITFTTGYANGDINYIRDLNVHKTGIFIVGAGSQVNPARIEMLASANYGLTYYFREENYNRDDLLDFLEKITHPIAKDIKVNFEKEDIYNYIPNNCNSLFAGTNYMCTGKYISPENTFFAILGETPDSQFVKIFQTNFTGDSVKSSFADKIWAKTAINRLEWQIEIEGENQELKDSLIELSLKYGIRCRYTSYIATYSVDDIVEVSEDNILLPNDFSNLVRNYPNPFNPSTTLRFFVSERDIKQIKFLKIYNILGQLVYVIDISNFTQGWHELVFNGKDFNGNNLASGTYLVSLQIGNKIANTIKIALVK